MLPFAAIALKVNDVPRRSGAAVGERAQWRWEASNSMAVLMRWLLTVGPAHWEIGGRAIEARSHKPNGV